MENEIITKFEKGLNSYLTKEQVRKQCPVAFAKGATNPDVTDKYLFVNSETIIDDLAKLGWKPVTAAMRKSRGASTIYSKHMISFQNPDIIIKGKEGDDAFPRIIMSNSHDGLQSFRFSVGIFRLVCSNGLVVADEKFSDFRIAHKGYTFTELREVVDQAVKDLPKRVEVMNQMKKKVLTQEEKNQLALDALLIRAGVKEEDKSKYEYDEETIEDILEPKRKADEGDDLWAVFNIIQEKITQGDFHAALKGAKVRKVRKITSFEKDLEVNKKLFRLASDLVQ